jgi:hypothetical protein
MKYTDFAQSNPLKESQNEQIKLLSVYSRLSGVIAYVILAR